MPMPHNRFRFHIQPVTLTTFPICHDNVSEIIDKLETLIISQKIEQSHFDMFDKKLLNLRMLRISGNCSVPLFKNAPGLEKLEIFSPKRNIFSEFGKLYETNPKLKEFIFKPTTRLSVKYRGNKIFRQYPVLRLPDTLHTLQLTGFFGNHPIWCDLKKNIPNTMIIGDYMKEFKRNMVFGSLSPRESFIAANRIIPKFIRVLIFGRSFNSELNISRTLFPGLKILQLGAHMQLYKLEIDPDNTITHLHVPVSLVKKYKNKFPAEKYKFEILGKHTIFV